MVGRKRQARPSIYVHEHAKIDFFLAVVRCRYFVGRFSSIVSIVTLSLWLTSSDHGYD